MSKPSKPAINKPRPILSWDGKTTKTIGYTDPHADARAVAAMRRHLFRVANNGSGSTKQGSAKRNRYMGATNMGKSLGRLKQKHQPAGSPKGGQFM